MTPTSTTGHFARLRQRYADNGISTLQDYEIIELLLTFSIPRQDTKPAAKALLKRFRTIGAILNATPEQLQEIDGIGPRSALLIQLLRDISAVSLKGQTFKRPILNNYTLIADYLRSSIGRRGEEYMIALFLDNGNRLIDTSMVAEGTVNYCTVYPRQIIELALRQKAAGIILAHNHPGGSLEPSSADWQLTHRFFELGTLLDLPLHDHIIVSADKIVSLRNRHEWPSGSKGDR